MCLSVLLSVSEKQYLGHDWSQYFGRDGVIWSSYVIVYNLSLHYRLLCLCAASLAELYTRQLIIWIELYVGNWCDLTSTQVYCSVYLHSCSTDSSIVIFHTVVPSSVCLVHLILSYLDVKTRTTLHVSIFFVNLRIAFMFQFSIMLGVCLLHP